MTSLRFQIIKGIPVEVLMTKEQQRDLDHGKGLDQFPWGLGYGKHTSSYVTHKVQYSLEIAEVIAPRLNLLRGAPLVKESE